jgi:hypothetical protein
MVVVGGSCARELDPIVNRNHRLGTRTLRTQSLAGCVVDSGSSSHDPRKCWVLAQAHTCLSGTHHPSQPPKGARQDTETLRH